MQAVLEQKRKSDISTGSSHEGKYLTFVLCGEEYGIEILKVREIIGIMNITPVPQTPGHIKGSNQPAWKGHSGNRFKVKIRISGGNAHKRNMHNSSGGAAPPYRNYCRYRIRGTGCQG